MTLRQKLRRHAATDPLRITTASRADRCNCRDNAALMQRWATASISGTADGGAVDLTGKDRWRRPGLIATAWSPFSAHVRQMM